VYSTIVEDNINGKLGTEGIEKTDSIILNYNASGLILNAKYYSSTSDYNEEYVFYYQTGSVQIEKIVSDTSSGVNRSFFIYYYNDMKYITQVYTLAFQTHYNYDDSGKIISTRLFQGNFQLRLDSNFVYDTYNNLLSFDYTNTFYTFEYSNFDMSPIFRSDINHELFNGALPPFGGLQ
jgi:hypothetical protein